MAVSIHGNNGVITTNGTAAAPSFAAPDNDTGLYFGTNLIHATTSGTNRFNIDANGNVIVNNTNAAAGSYTYKLLTSDNIGSSEQTFGIQYPSVVTYGLNAESNADFTIKKDGTERLRINSTGAIVKQQFTATNTYAANDTTQCGYQAQNLSDTTNTYAALRLTAGNSSPATAQIASIRTGTGQNDLTIQLETGNTAFEALRIKSTGKVGINNDNPQRILHVGKSGTAEANIRIQGGSDYGEIRVKDSDNNLSFHHNVGGAGSRELFNSNGSTGHFSINCYTYQALTITTNENGANGPEIQLMHNSASPAVNDVVGQIRYSGKDSAGNTTLYSKIQTKVLNVTDGSEAGHLDFSTRGGGAYNSIFRLNARSTASAPSYTTDDMNGIILDTYNTGSPYPRYFNFIAKSAGDTDSNIGFWTESVGGSPTEKLRIAADGKVSVGTVQTSHLLSTIGGSSKQLLVQGTEADIWMTSTGGSSTTWRILGSTGGNTHRFRVYDHTNSREPFIITNDGNVGIYGATAGSFQTINSVAGSNVRGIEIHKDGTDTGTAIKLAGDAGNGSKQFSQLGFSGANLTAHWATYNTASNKVGEIMMGNTGMVGLNPGSYAPLSSLDVRHHQGTAGGASGPSTVVTICAGRNSARGMEIKTGRPTSGNQNDAAVYYNAKDTESSTYHAQHVWQLGGTNRMVLGYTGGGARLGVGTDTPNGRNGSIDITCDDTTTWSPTADQRSEASLTLRNNSANTNTFTALHFFNGGGTGTDITLAAVRKANFEADFHLMRRINNAGSGNDWRTSVTSRGLNTGPKVIIWAEGDGDNNGDQQCGNHIFESQQMPGFNQYVYWNFKIGSASYSRAGSLRYHCTWSTGHASGTGYQIGTILWVNNHSNSTCNVVEHLVYRRRYNGGHYYGWTSNPEMKIFRSNNTGQNASIIFRAQGHGSHNSNSYNMSTVVHLHIEHMSVAQNSITPRLERFGSTSVSGTGSEVTGTSLGYCTFSDTQPTAGNADF